MRAEELDGRHHHQPGKDAAGKDHAGDTRSNDVTHAEVLRSGVGADRRAGIPAGRVGWRAGPDREHIFVLEKGIKRAQAEAGEDATGERAAFIAGDQHVGAGCAFRIEQVAVLLHDQLPPQRDHEAERRAIRR